MLNVDELFLWRRPMKFSCYLILLICILSTHTLHAVNWDFPSESIGEIIVVGSGANIQMSQMPTGSPIKIMVSGPLDNRWTSFVEGNKLRLQSSTLSNANGQETSIQIQLPTQKKITVALNEGKINLGPQVGTAFIHILKGQVVAQKTQELLQIFIQRGDAIVDSHQGELNIESYSAKLVVKNQKGSLDLNNFKGETIVENPLSRVNIQSRMGNARILSPRSGINFSWGSGQLSISELLTRCEGNLEEGSLTVSALADSEVDIRAIKGKVQVNLPNSSGAWLNLRTSGNEIAAPSPIQPAKDAKYSVVKGRLSGSNKGSVIVQGEETSVIVR
jgi:hypothetical protein